MGGNDFYIPILASPQMLHQLNLNVVAADAVQRLSENIAN